MTSALRLAIAAAVAVLLARSARAAWTNRALALSIWRRVRLRHLFGSVALLVLVAVVAVTLLTLIPLTGLGLGSVLGFTGNAVFAPVEQVATLDDPVGAAPTTGAIVAIVTAGFLALLLTLFPWLAFVEEQIFRLGLERAGTGRQVWTALRFGLVHMVMLVPLAAALAIAVAGFFYGRVYLRTYRRMAGDEMVAPVIARREAVLASTVWHATFNSLIIVLLLVLLAAEGSLL